MAHVDEGAVTGLEARQALQQAREEAQCLAKQALAATQQRKLQHSHSDPSAIRKQPSSGRAMTGASGNTMGHQPFLGAGEALRRWEQPFPGAVSAALGLMPSHGAVDLALGSLNGVSAAAVSSQMLSSLMMPGHQMHIPAMHPSLHSGPLDRVQSAQSGSVVLCYFCLWCAKGARTCMVLPPVGMQQTKVSAFSFRLRSPVLLLPYYFSHTFVDCYQAVCAASSTHDMPKQKLCLILLLAADRQWVSARRVYTVS